MYCDPSGLAKDDNKIFIEIVDNKKFREQFSVLGESHTKTYVIGTVYSKGSVNTIDRTVYQLNDIDWDYVSPSIRNPMNLSNRELARRGKVPFGSDDMWIELHHLTQEEPGAMIGILGGKHDKYSKQLHGQIEKGKSFRNNPELNAQYNKFREEYWKERIAEVEKKKKVYVQGREVKYMENYIEIEQKIDKYLKNEEIEFSSCFLGGVNEKEIEETEKTLNVILPNSYKFFLKKYGSGGIEGMTFWGIEANKKQVEEYTIVAITEEYRKNGLPHNLIVIEENGDYITCLETDKMDKNKECPVVTWSCYDEDEIVPLEKNFYTYLLNRIEDYI